MIAGTLANALYDRFSDESTHWEEKFMLNQIDPNQTIWDMISVHDTLFTAGTSKFYISTDNGVSWNRIGNQLLSTYNNLLNAREALLVARNIFNGVTNNTTYYYLKKSELASAFVPFSSVLDHFSYRMAISDNKIWDASSRGLYYLSLSELPGISDPDDHGSDTVIPPVEPGNYPFTVGHVYPNPVAGEAHLSLSLDTTRTVSASLYDLAGRQVSVIANHQHLAAGNNTISFRMDNLGSGIYFLRLQVNNDIFKREIIHIN
jgi:hypothetical protein